MSFADRFIRSVEPQLSRILSAVRRIEQYLGPDDDWVERLRRKIWVAADPFLRPLGRPTVAVKSDVDYICTTESDSDSVEVAIHPLYERNTTSTRKCRIIDGALEWAVGSWVYDPPDEPWQHHVYIFENESGGTDVYGHKEDSTRDPVGHVTDPQIHGDPDGHLRNRLALEGIDHRVRDVQHPYVPWPEASRNYTTL